MLNDERDSFRRIVAATSIVGGATAITIVIGVARMKIFALALGPAGIGLIGVLASIMGVGAAIGGMGLGFSGVRQIASSEKTRAIARRALWLATWPMAIFAGVALWIGRASIAQLVTASADHALSIGLTGIGVVLTIAATSQIAVIQGYQRTGDLARARIYGALLALIIGVPAVLYGGPMGIVAAVVAVPIGNTLAALPYRPRAEPGGDGATAKELCAQWQHLFALGAVVMVTTSLTSLALVLVRAAIIAGEGIEAAGLYQAAVGVSAMNVSLILSAMSADFFPHLASIEGDRPAANRLVNQQLRATILLGAPILMALVALAPIVLQLFYSNAFTPAAAMLRWQVAGELLKFPGWALGFVLVARGDKWRFLFVELLFTVLYLAGTTTLLPLFGLAGVGVAYLLAYAGYSVVLIMTCRRRHGIVLSPQNLRALALVLGALIGVTLLASTSPLGAGLVGLALAAGLAIHALRELEQMTNLLARFKGRAGDDSRHSPPPRLAGDGEP